MKYCPYCGSYNNNINGNFCEQCGAPLKNGNVTYNNPSNYNYNNNNNIQEGSTIGWGILGFFVPLAGLVLFIAWHNDKPKSAKSAGTGALIRVILSIILFFIALFFFIITEPNYEIRERVNNTYDTWERRYEEDWT